MPGYGSDDGFTAYMSANGYTVPAGSIPAARARGSLYIDGAYADRFPGSPTGGMEQERAWPRTGAVDAYGNAVAHDAIPTRVVQASYEAALLELQTPGSLAVIATANERIKRMKAGSIELEYADNASTSAVVGAIPMSTRIEGLLAPLIDPARALPAILVV
jgi:hypothetical protein